MKARRERLWIILGAAAFGLQALFGRDSALAEKVYSRGLFVAFRWGWDYTFGLAPIPCLYLFTAALALFLGFRWIRHLTRPGNKMRVPALKRAGRFLLAAAGWAGRLVFFFYLLWGFNYNRVGLSKQMGIEPAPLTRADLANETAWASSISAEARAAVPGASSNVLGKDALPSGLESVLREAMTGILRQAGYPAPGRVRVRSFVPGGWMMRFSSTGVYIPYFGEAYTASNLLPHEKPFTMAHEMAHGFGITDEGEAGFLAFLACRAAADPMARYSGCVGYWEYAAGELARVDPQAFRALWAGLPGGMKADVRAAELNAARFRGVIDKVSRKVYGKYLESQGIEDGISSYSRFVGLVAAWKRKNAGT
ncbi:MAG: DUF3810 domain-containing protein [Acidobacteriota bacterium]|nr:DUF3810 domain-containing protein [Acidobacteriota bacterium]